MSALPVDVVFLGDPERDRYKYGNLFNYLERSYQFYLPSLQDRFEELGYPKLVVTSLEWAPTWRSYIVAARSKGARILYLLDGIADWNLAFENTNYILKEGGFLQPTFADKIAVIGKDQARLVSLLGYGNRIELLGIPRFDEYAGMVLPPPRQDKTTVLVVSPRTFALNERSRYHRIRALQDLSAYLESRDDVRVIYRLADDAAAILQRESSYHTADIVADLQEAHLVVAFTSTAIYESIHFDKPTILLEYDATPNFINLPWEIHCKEQLQPVLDDALDRDELKMKLQRQVFRDHLSHVGSASKELSRLIDWMVTAEDITPPFLEDTPSEPYESVYDYRKSISYSFVERCRDLAFLQYSLDGAQKLVDLQARELAAKDRAIADLEKAFTASLSWRVTEPLRRLRRLLGW